MAKQPDSSAVREPNKRDLHRQIGRTGESITDTVEEIKERAEQGYESAKETVSETVSGVLDYREQFQKEPVVWSLGALSAGFALGYTLGYAHKNIKRGKSSPVMQFADQVVDGLSSVGQNLVVPALNENIKGFLGFDFSELINDMRGKEAPKAARGIKETEAETRHRKISSEEKKIALSLLCQ